MAELHANALFELIHALTPSEKRYFQLYASRMGGGNDKKFIRLFEFLSKASVYDEKLLLKKLNDINPVQLPNMKAHLYQRILQALRAGSSQASVDLQLSDQLSFARLLYDKCLYNDCLRLIDKAKRAALLHHRNHLLLGLLELEKLAIRKTIAGDNDNRVRDAITRTDNAATRIANINSFSNLSMQLHAYYVRTGFIRDPKDLQEVTRFFKRNLPAYNEKKLAFGERIHLYDALVGFYFYTQDFTHGYANARKWVALFDSQPEMIRSEPEFYIRALNSLLVAQNKLGYFTEFVQTHRKLVALKRHKELALNRNLNLTLLKAIYIHEINRHFLLGEFRSGTRIVGKLEDDLNRFVPLLDHNSVLIFYYKIACLYFGSDQYKRALHWLNRIINAKDVDLREDLHTFARILALISHYELGNDQLVEYYLKSLYRFILKKGHISAYYKLILQFLKQLSKNTTGKKLIRQFNELKGSLEKLTHNRFEKRAFYYFDILTWLESKITARSMETLVKERRAKQR
jgi:hypothetical protein